MILKQDDNSMVLLSDSVRWRLLSNTPIKPLAIESCFFASISFPYLVSNILTPVMLSLEDGTILRPKIRRLTSRRYHTLRDTLLYSCICSLQVETPCAFLRSPSDFVGTALLMLFFYCYYQGKIMIIDTLLLLFCQERETLFIEYISSSNA